MCDILAIYLTRFGSYPFKIVGWSPPLIYTADLAFYKDLQSSMSCP